MEESFFNVELLRFTTKIEFKFKELSVTNMPRINL